MDPLAEATLSQLDEIHDDLRSGAWCLVHAVAHSEEHRGHVALTGQLWELARVVP